MLERGAHPVPAFLISMGRLPGASLVIRPMRTTWFRRLRDPDRGAKSVGGLLSSHFL